MHRMKVKESLIFPTKRALRVEKMHNRLCCWAIHAGCCYEFIDGCRLDLIKCAEVRPKTLPPLWSDADDVIEHGDEVALAAQFAMKGDRKAVRLVADALDELEGLAAARQLDRLRVPLGKDELELLCETDDRYVLVPCLISDDLERGGELSLPAVDDDEIRQLLFRQPHITACCDLAHG